MEAPTDEVVVIQPIFDMNYHPTNCLADPE
jgi:hypothetical protein